MVDDVAKWGRFSCGPARQACWAGDDGPKGRVLSDAVGLMREKEKEVSWVGWAAEARKK
jgi:hypothetical protein